MVDEMTTMLPFVVLTQGTPSLNSNDVKVNGLVLPIGPVAWNLRFIRTPEPASGAVPNATIVSVPGTVLLTVNDIPSLINPALSNPI